MRIASDVVDYEVLASWMDSQGLPGGEIEDVEQLGGGTQNVLLKFRRGGTEFVLRRGPKHLRAKTNEVLRREARVLSALDGTDVPAPRIIAACPDETVMHGAVFYLMTPVDGFNATTGLPALHAGDASIRHRMGLEAAISLARLGAVDHEAVGLDGYGRPEGFLERQVPRWTSELEGYSKLDGYDGPEIPGLDDVAAWLESHRPADWRPGIMHGDYHLANLMFSPSGPEVAAIVDWEMSTIGDPLLDLGWLLATWPDADSVDIAGPVGQAGGLPEPAELIAAYAANSTRNLDAIDWYAVLACFKLGIVLEGTHARAAAGKAPREVGDLLHTITLGLFARAEKFISGGAA
ncbi:phosphotransferase family protein [Actinocorallia longicatena]|uniref:Phosphotransferase family protein n=1 Tax=Actinocorallia longicatena TaxID=111803 RepID=A0ABP6QNA0_9ACTN